MKMKLLLIFGFAMFVCTLVKSHTEDLEGTNGVDEEQPDRIVLMEGDYFEGDIVVTKDRNGIINPANRWPGAVIPYRFDEGVGYAVRKAVGEAIQDFNKYTCVRWVPRTSQRDYVQIYQLREKGCFSSVGKVGGRQSLNLQYPGCHNKGTAIHEMMHATGFWHEQSRPDRDNYVRINYRNVQRGRAFNFDKLSTRIATTLGVPYDYGSVMHYSAHAFSGNRRPTLEPLKPLKGKTLGQHYGFAASDYVRINRMYKCVNFPR